MGKRLIHIKHALKGTAGLLLFLIGFLIIWKGLRYALFDNTRTYSRFSFHEFYNLKENIDTLFVGSSHCFVSVNPAVMDRELNRNTFNLGRNAQTLDGSLMVIKEAVKYHPIKQIYLEMFYGIGGYTRKSRNEMEQTYLVSDYLKPSIEKYLYMLRASNSQQYIYTFFPMRREWKFLYDPDQILEIIVNKASDAYLNPESNEYYAGKGFVAQQGEITDWNNFRQTLPPINPDVYRDSDWQEDLQKIIRFCKDNQIELTLFSAPMSDFQLSIHKNYDDYITMLQSLLEGTGVSYWDFNLCKEEYFPSDSALFYDTEHLNSKAADIFSHLLARFIKGEISPDELFYNSYAEKLSHLDPNILGVTYRIEEDAAGTAFRSCQIISTPTEGMEYQITILPAEGEPCLIQDYAQNTVFSLTEEGAGKILINWRVKGKPENSGERTIDFPAG